METSRASQAEQELAYIRKVIDDSRQSFSEDGKPYIIWGAIVAVGILVTYISALLQRDFYTSWIWIGLVAFGILYSIANGMRARKQAIRRASNFVERLQGAIWGACGTALGLSILLIMFGYQFNAVSIPPIFTCSIVSIILGIAYFLSGFVLQIAWLRNISIAWWLGAIAMFFIQSVHVLAMYAGMLILFQVIPGIVLNRRYRQFQRSRPTAVST